MHSSMVVPAESNSIFTPSVVSSTRRAPGRTTRSDCFGYWKSFTTVVP